MFFTDLNDRYMLLSIVKIFITAFRIGRRKKIDILSIRISCTAGIGGLGCLLFLAMHVILPHQVIIQII